MKLVLAFVTLLGTAFSVGASLAQDVGLAATFGEARLATGEGRNIHTVEIVAGGRIDVSQSVGVDFRGRDCDGGVANAPDYRVQYTAGETPLVFLVRARENTTLIVNAPNGRWYCDDSSGGWPDPLVVFDELMSGQYDIWIGAYEDLFPEAVLIVSESKAMLP
jgi:hypothetical protein